jgi:hypothetical protein
MHGTGSPSDCISFTEGTIPQGFFLPLDANSSQCSAIGDDGVMG